MFSSDLKTSVKGAPIAVEGKFQVRIAPKFRVRSSEILILMLIAPLQGEEGLF